MEGYTNISSNQEDFDDLDIEGRNARNELNSEEPFASKKEPRSTLERRVLGLKVKIDECTNGYVFSVKTFSGNARWRCHLCDVLVIGHEHVDTHIESRKHQLKLALPVHPRHLFTRIETNKSTDIPKLAPGEPVPPGFEDVVKRVAQIQDTLDSHNTSPLIGLEYLVELTPEERGKEPSYVCMLCDKKGDPRVAMVHINSFNHRSKYIGIHFPTANKVMMTEYPRSKDGKKLVSTAVNYLCTKLEERFGRLQPVVVERELFEKNKEAFKKQIDYDAHFRETPTETFVEHLQQDVINCLINLEDVPLPASEPNSKSTFYKGRITCDRSRLRSRNSEEPPEEENVFKKLAEMEKHASESKKTERKSLEHASKEGGIDTKGTEMKSLSSVSSISSSSLSPSRSRSRSHSKSRSRSRSRYGRREGRYGRSWGRSRRSRSRSRSRRSRSRSRSRGRSRSRSRDSRGRRRRSPQYRRSKNDRYKHDDKKKGQATSNKLAIERGKWVKFRQEADKVERDMVKLLKFHEKNPEKHPMYPEEWKRFWNRRYKELQSEGKDPSKHDFKPEWIEFWNKRMKEMHEEELKSKKDEWKVKLGLPKEEEEAQRPPVQRKRKAPVAGDDDVIVISPSSTTEKEERIKKDVTVADIKNTWRALTGSEIKDASKRSPSPWEDQDSSRGLAAGHHSPPHSGRWWQERSTRGGLGMSGRGRMGRSRNMYRDEFPEENPHVVTVLRLLTAMENQLGSLGPRVNNLLSKSLALEKLNPDSSNSLMSDEENVVLFETVKEKLKGQLFAGIVERNMVMATRSSIQNLTRLLHNAEKMAPPTKALSQPTPTPVLVPVPVPVAEPAPIAEPVTVPGVGTMDKVAIAQQIAAALVTQGKTDVSHDELEQLINAVVGMAQASSGSHEPITAAAFFAQQQKQANQLQKKTSREEQVEVSQKLALDPPNKIKDSQFQMLLSAVTSRASIPRSSSDADEPRVSGLQLLQSAYDDKIPIHLDDKAKLKLPLKMHNPFSNMSRSDNMDDLSEDDLKTLLQNFKDLSSEEQQGLIIYLKKIEAKDPVRVERLRKFVNLGQPSTSLDIDHPNIMSSNFKSNSDSPATIKKEDTNSVYKSGRLSPFSLRQGGCNPTLDERGKRQRMDDTDTTQTGSNNLKLDDSDEDYSFEDIYAAASKKVKEREKAKEAEETAAKSHAKDDALFDNKKTEDPKAILRETKEIIANLMGQLPAKYIQKQSPRTDSPATQQIKPNVASHLENSPLQLGSNVNSSSGVLKITTITGDRNPTYGNRPVPVLNSSARSQQQPQQYQPQFPGYQQQPDPSYGGNQYGHQGSYPNMPEGYEGNYSGATNYGGGFNSGGYYSGQPPQSAHGSYSEPYTNQSMGTQPAFPDTTYPNQFDQQPFQPPTGGMYNQFPSQQPGYY